MLRQRSRGFTIVELVVVIAVIAIIASVAIVGYGSWRSNTLNSKVKSDLNQAAAAMESANNFGAGYPSSMPTTFTPSSDVTITIASGSSLTAFCLDGSVSGSSTTFYILNKGNPTQGTCATALTAPTNLTIPPMPGPYFSDVTASWTAVSGATSYELQMAYDSAFTQYTRTITTASSPLTFYPLNTVVTPYVRVRGVVSGWVGPYSSTVYISPSNYPFPP